MSRSQGAGFPDEETIRWIQPRITEFFRRRLPGHVDPADLVAEVMLAFANYRGEASPKHYAFMVARRKLAQVHRQPKRIEPVSTQREFRDPNTGVSTQMRRVDVRAAVWSELASIEAPYGEVVRLKLSGLEPNEIAKELDLNPNTVRSRLARGLARLRARLEAVFGGYPLD